MTTRMTATNSAWISRLAMYTLDVIGVPRVRLRTPVSRCTVSPIAMFVKQAEITANDAMAAT